MSFSPDGSQLTGALAYTLETYPSPYAQVCEMPAGLLKFRLPAINIVYAVYSHDGRSLFTLASQGETYQRDFANGVIQVWTLDGELITTLPPQDAVRLAFSHDGKILAVGLDNGQVQLWSLDGQLLQELDPARWV